GSGDVSVFEVIVKTRDNTNRILLKSDRGQAELTALSAVLHTEALLNKNIQSGQYFAHQLYREDELLKGLQQYDSITVKVI
ncbi:MAG: saccharopine dehydrogenase, partial [Flavobacterium sp.]